MAVAGCINAYDCAGCYLTTLQQLQSDNIGVAINYTAPGEYGRRQLDYIKYTDKCGCTCCLTNENELRIVATQGVIKNFTLTNDDTNERVIVKWNDLFGSNRAYTMVRYKTGSYPTSITDGTLAVKETTQNQYSVSGYNVSGLTDGTTYYFTAFAVSQDGTIIVVQNKTIVPDFRRHVNSNTLLYMPLQGNTNDLSGNGRNGTWTGTANYVDGPLGKVARIYNTSSYTTVKVSAQLPNLTTFTICCWFMMPAVNTSYYNTPMLVGYTAGRCLGIWFVYDGTYHSCIGSFASPESIFNYNWVAGKWYNIIMTRNSSTNVNKYFINGELVQTLNASINFSDYTLNFGSGMNNNSKVQNIEVCEMIAENRERTDTEKQKYFNKTKTPFGY